MQNIYRAIAQLLLTSLTYWLASLVTRNIVDEKLLIVLTPLLNEQVPVVVPVICAGIVAYAFQIYSWTIDRILRETALRLPQGTHKNLVSADALGTGKKRKPARLLLGVK